MNHNMSDRIKHGIEFEKEAFEILKKKFKSVEWLSNGKKSTFDFKCLDSCGESFFVEAKSSKTSNKININAKQKHADFIIFKNKDNEIMFIGNRDFSKFFYLEDDEEISNKTYTFEAGRRLRSVKKYGHSYAIPLTKADMKDFNLKVGDEVVIDDIFLAQDIVDSCGDTELTADENISNILTKQRNDENGKPF